MRRTESVSLLRQIILRGARLFEGQEFFNILDYAENIKTHFPDGDVFAPKIVAKKNFESSKQCKAICPDCNYENEFTVNIKHVEYGRDKSGYCLDLDGSRIETDYGPLPAHHGRRCLGQEKTGKFGEYERCGYRWTSKECPECTELNDIAARYCCSCKAEIVNPNEKLREAFAKFKKTPTSVQTDEVISMTVREGISQRGNKTVRADFVTPWRSFSVWFTPESPFSRQQGEFRMFEQATHEHTPSTVTYQKNAASGFYNVIAYGRPIDNEPD